MIKFHYQALNADDKPTTGEIEADSVAQAVARLELLGMTVLAIGRTEPTGNSLGAAATGHEGENPFSRLPSAQVIEAEQQAMLRSHMATVVERARPIVPALRAYAAELPQGRRRRQLSKVLDVVERGDVAEATLAMSALPGYWIALFSAAATSQDPGRMLREFLQETRRADELQRQWLLTLAYPAVLLTLAAVVIVGLSLFVVPVFREIFSGFGLRLPWISVAVVTVSDAINSGRVLLALIAVIVVAVLLWQARRWLPTGVKQRFSDTIGFRFGRSTVRARFAQYAADLIEAELSPVQAARLAGIATGNASIRAAAWRWAATPRPAVPSVAAPHRRKLTSTVLHALEGGMPTRARVELLRVVSTCYAETARRRLSWTHGIVEPIAICLVGIVIGFTLLALLLPLLNLLWGLSS